MSTPTNNDDMIDSRDIIERIEELTDELEGLTSHEAAATANLAGEWIELKELQAFASEFEDYTEDYQYGQQASSKRHS